MSIPPPTDTLTPIDTPTDILTPTPKFKMKNIEIFNLKTLRLHH
jgi:hypothetical protein